MVMTTKYPSSHNQLASGPPPDCQAAPTMIRLASATPKQPSDILVTLDGSARRFACHAHSATMNGVKAKIMNGLNAWNQVTGIAPHQMTRRTARSVESSAHSALVWPCCAYVAQNNV